MREEWDKEYVLNSYCDVCKMNLVEEAFKMMDKEIIKIQF
jgi:pentatricopeptide repeat protein